MLYRLLTALATSFEPYNPDNTVMIYLKQHSQALKWEHKFDFRPPKEKESKEITTITRTINHLTKEKTIRINVRISLTASHPNPNESE